MRVLLQEDVQRLQQQWRQRMLPHMWEGAPVIWRK
jgi:hypothetical protein